MNKFLAALVLVPLLRAGAPAMDFQKAARYELPGGRTLTNELWLAADTIRFDGAAARAVFLQGREIRLNGDFQRDVWALADSVAFAGTARQDVRLAARQDVEVKGRIDSGLTVLAATIRLDKTAVIAEDATLFGQEIASEARVGGRLLACGTHVTLSGRVGGNARIVADDITVMPGTEIQGNLVYTSPKELFTDPSVKLKGQLIHKANVAWPINFPQPSAGQQLLLQAALFFAAVLAGLPFLAVFPRFTAQSVWTLQQQHSKCLLAGVISVALLLMLGVLSLVTWIGIPLGLLLLGSLGILQYLAKIPVALLLAGRVLRGTARQRPMQALPVLTLGLFLLYLAAALPMVGFAVWLLTVFYGLGAFVVTILAGQRALPVALPAPEPPRDATPPPVDGFTP